MRGEQLLARYAEKSYTGSPPHARGAVNNGYAGVVYLRITPACAGSRTNKPDKSLFIRDHPRMRGEQTKKVQSYKGFFVFFYQISFNF